MIELTKKYKTRSGHPVELYTVTAQGLMYDHTVVGRVEGKTHTSTWKSDGRYLVLSELNSWDLVEDKPVHEGYTALYRGVSYDSILALGFWTTHERAVSYCKANPHTKWIAIVKNTFIEGEGL